jgi:hypothetical protein
MNSLADLLKDSFTDEYVDLVDADLPVGATLAFASQSTEERGRHPVWNAALQTRADHCVQLSPESGGAAHPYELLGAREGHAFAVSLRDDMDILRVLGGTGTLILDISGLTHQAWASIVRAILRADVPRAFSVIYVEPARYRSHDTPATLGSFDLSVRFEGVRPIPGFARLSGRTDSGKRVFIPLLGFEGSRPRLVHAELDPPTVVPIIGLPGFRIEFPAVAVACNQEYLDESRSYTRLRTARGACPFDAFRVIDQIVKDESADHIQLAPLGTKPHALGAFLYSLLGGKNSEIVYDHPVRRPNRTEGIGMTHVYRVSDFVGAM